jgi:hypothetical protein
MTPILEDFIDSLKIPENDNWGAIPTHSSPTVDIVRGMHPQSSAIHPNTDPSDTVWGF